MEPVFIRYIIRYIPQKHSGNAKVTFTDLSPVSKLKMVENTTKVIKHNFISFLNLCKVLIY